MTLKLKLLAAAIAGAVVSASAGAATVSLVGNGFSVSYDDTLNSLFGTPTLIGNLLSFSPSGFSVGSGGGRPALLDAVLDFQVVAADGYRLDSVSLFEGGSYTIAGSDASFGIASVLNVAALDNGGLTTLGGAGSFAGSPFLSAGSWRSSGDGFTAAGLSSSLLDITLDSTLFANAAGSSFVKASLDTAQITFGVAQVPSVPEPEAYLMLLTGLGMVGMAARRRAASR
ncbi:PEP-CTERM sorting domain-containing protein [Aromatoleum evansii]|uniref:PEP-CTERM sorting domain-containing protein n=1 Tax=Aromatoleum evansii TaxID=59406 RepID=A0ABZ1AEH5_AROEV|nr:PEP-CTERM sorting domain-containing protein [Aromatoleum evansii]